MHSQYIVASSYVLATAGSSYLSAVFWIWAYKNAHRFRLPNVSYSRRKVGGITFLRLGRLRFSFCIAKK